MDLNPSDKLEFFVELFTEFAAGPLIDQGHDGHDVLIKMLNHVSTEVDAANDGAQDDTSEEIFEAVMGRIKGVTALISRTHGDLKSPKADAMTVRSEGDVGGSSLYTKLTRHGY